MMKLTEDRLFIDDFSDVLTIKDDKIEFIYQTYNLAIEGETLQVVSFSRQEMIIKGKILGVMFMYHHAK